MRHTLSCAAVEELLADYFDGTLGGDQRQAVEQHLAECAACAALAQDARSAMDFMAEVEEPAIPPDLVTRILQGVPSRWSGRFTEQEGVRGFVNRLVAPLLQPRLVMGAMMTVLSLSMMTRCAGAPNHPLAVSDLDPVKVWAGFDGRMHRAWERTVKTYESMRVVYEVQSRLREWKQSENDPAAADAAIEIRKVPSSVSSNNGKAAKDARDAASSNTQ
jgi:hypothetical protein